MSYMERNFDKRMDTTKLVEGSKSVISLFIIIILLNELITIKILKYQNMHMVRLSFYN